MSVLGIDIGGTSVKVVCVEEGEVVWERQSERYQRPDFPQLEACLVKCLDGARGEVIGVCAPGAFDVSRGTVTASANMPCLVGVDLAGWIKGLAGEHAKVVVETDVYATAMSIWRERFGRGRMCVIALGTGVGMSILTDGQRLLINGKSSGHLGQIDVTLDDVPPVVGTDGGKGGLEGYIGLAALRARYGEDVEGAIAAMDEKSPPLRALARAIRIVHAIYRPDEIVLAGGVGILLKAASKPLGTLISDGLTNLARPQWKLRFAGSAFHAARGVAMLASEV